MEVCWSGVSVESDDSEHVESDDSEHNGSMLEWSQYVESDDSEH